MPVDRIEELVLTGFEISQNVNQDTDINYVKTEKSGSFRR